LATVREVVMGKPDELTAKERRQFEQLIRTYFEFEAYDPHPGGLPTPPAGTERGRGRRLWSRWRRRGDGPVEHPH
jgi:hypothetical protein